MYVSIQVQPSPSYTRFLHMWEGTLLRCLPLQKRFETNSKGCQSKIDLLRRFMHGRHDC